MVFAVKAGARFGTCANLREVGRTFWGRMPDPVSLGDSITAETLPAPSLQTSVEAQTAASSIEARRLGKIPGLDGVRGIAAVIVVVCHFNVILPIPAFAVVPGGTVPLDMFFVLSGFLITSLLLREQSKNGRIGKWAFYERRILRLVPALVVVLAAHSLFAYLTGISFHEEWTSLTAVGFYYSNWKLAFNSNVFGGNIANGLQHMWSLSFEEQFYLIWPWITIFLLTIRQQLRTVIAVMLAMMAVVDVHMALMYHGIGSYYADSIRTDTRAGSILMERSSLTSGCVAESPGDTYPSPPGLRQYFSWSACRLPTTPVPFCIVADSSELTSHAPSSFWPSWMASGPADISFSSNPSFCWGSSHTAYTSGTCLFFSRSAITGPTGTTS